MVWLIIQISKTYCFRCKKYKRYKTLSISCISSGRVTFSAHFYEWNNKKNRFIKEQEARRLLNSLGVTTTPIKIPLFYDILLSLVSIWLLGKIALIIVDILLLLVSIWLLRKIALIIVYLCEYLDYYWKFLLCSWNYFKKPKKGISHTIK